MSRNKKFTDMDDLSRSSSVSVIEDEGRFLSWNEHNPGRSNYLHPYSTRFKEKIQEKLNVNQYTDQETNRLEYPETPRGFINTTRVIKMERQIRCCNENHNNWLRYFCGFFILGLSYVIIQEIKNNEKITTIFNDLEKLKKSQDPTPTQSDALSKLQNAIANMKRQQELYQRSLQHVVRQEFDTYSADKTGKTDYALELTGGKVVSLLPGTENFDSAKTLFGLTLCEGVHGPRAMLQADMSPGHCWAFKGTQGGAIVKLLGRVKVTGVTVEHISANISPTGEVSSAPKDFTVWGLSNPNDRGQQLGTFHYDIKGPLVQTFSVPKPDVFEYVEFRVMTNHGNPEFTCVYRFRVHGQLEDVNVKT